MFTSPDWYHLSLTPEEAWCLGENLTSHFLLVTWLFFPPLQTEVVGSWTLPIHPTIRSFFPGSAKTFLSLLNLLISNSWWIVIPFGKLKLQKHKSLKIDVTRLLRLNKDHMCSHLGLSSFCLVSGTSPTLWPFPASLFSAHGDWQSFSHDSSCLVRLHLFWS